MKAQEVSVKFPNIQLLVGGEVVEQLKTYTTYVETVKRLRANVEQYTKRFIDDVTSSTRSVYRKDKGEDLHTIRPSIEVLVEGCRAFYVSAVEIESKRSLSKWGLPSGIGMKFPTAVAHTCLNSLEAVGVSITFPENEMTIDCPLRGNKGNWNWNLILSEVMITYEQGKEVKIKYGSFLHNALWRLNEELDPFRTSLENLQTFTTLQRLGLVEHEVLPKGEQVLEELKEIDPSDVPSLITLFASILLGSQSESIPIIQFVREHDFIKRPGTSNAELLSKGKNWLLDNCVAIVTSTSCPNDRKLALVGYMPYSHLPIFLAHGNEGLRKAAKKRADMLGGD